MLVRMSRTENVRGYNQSRMRTINTVVVYNTMQSYRTQHQTISRSRPFMSGRLYLAEPAHVPEYHTTVSLPSLRTGSDCPVSENLGYCGA
jgi:hypothetical protein